MVGMSGVNMTKRVLLVRGGSLGRNTGLGAAHYNLVDMLEAGKITGWELAGICEYPLAKTNNPFSRVWNRWVSHPRRVAKRIANLARNNQCDLVHITDQEQAHLVPNNSQLPVVITIHDLFHLYPEKLAFSTETIDVGEMNPGLIRKRDLNKLRHGINLADYLFCNSRHSLQAAKNNFSSVESICIPMGLDLAKYHPDNNQVLDLSLPQACNLLVVGSNDPRKRMQFLCKIIANLPDRIRHGIHIHHVGNSAGGYGLPSIHEMAKSYQLENWTIHGSSVSDEYLMTLRINCEALLFPSVSEGFGYPPIEAMAAGMKVLCADLPSHNELMPSGSCIPPDDIDAWTAAITEVFSKYEARKSASPERQLDLMEHAKKFDNTLFCQRLTDGYNSIVS